MSGWTENGVVRAIQYGQSCYTEALPAHISFALSLSGRSGVPGGAFTWAELGCGQALTSNVVAALYPRSQVFAVDLLPEHMENARALGEKAGLNNIHYFAESFEHFTRRDLPALDVIMLHGVWTWISPRDRDILTGIIDRCLKPGGVLWVSYNCLPGWAAHMPVRRLLLDHVRAGQGDLPDRLAQAQDFVTRISDLSGYFDRIPDAARHVAALQGRDPAYLAHEYLNRHWQPFYHADLAEHFAPLGLDFAGSATIADHLPHWRLGAASLRLLDTIRDPILFQTVRDTLADTRFRRDLFVRSGDPGKAQHEPFLGLTSALTEIPESIATPVGRLPLDGHLLGKVAEQLDQEPRRLTDLGLPGIHFERIRQAAVQLVALGLAAPCPPADRVRTERVRRLNQAMAAEPGITQRVTDHGMVVNHAR